MAIIKRCLIKSKPSELPENVTFWLLCECFGDRAKRYLEKGDIIVPDNNSNQVKKNHYCQNNNTKNPTNFYPAYVVNHVILI